MLMLQYLLFSSLVGICLTLKTWDAVYHGIEKDTPGLTAEVVEKYGQNNIDVILAILAFTIYTILWPLIFCVSAIITIKKFIK